MKRLVFHSPIFLVLVFFFVRCTNELARVESKSERVDSLAIKVRDAAIDFQSRGQSDSAFANFIKAKDLFIQTKDSANAAYSLLMMAGTLNAHNDYDELQTTAVEALQYLNKKKDSAYFPSLYNYLGISFAMSGDLANAEKNYRNGKKYTSSQIEIAKFDNNIAYAYLVAGNYTKAFGILSDIKSKYVLPDSEPMKATILDNYGFCAFKLRKTTNGNPMAQALELRLKNNDISGLISSYVHLAEIEQESNPKESIRKAVLAEEIAGKNNCVADRLEAIQFIVKNANPEVSKNFAKTYLRVSDSLQLANRKARNSFALFKYSYVKERERSLIKEAKYELEIQNERLTRIAVTLFALLLIGAIIWITLYFIKRSKRIKREATYEAEVRFSKTLHDDLANQIHRTIVFAETQKLEEPENKETLLSRLDSIYVGTRSISRDNSDVPEDGDFAKLVYDLLQEYNSGECKIIIQGLFEIKWQELAHFKRIEFYRILQELLANMRKHSKCSLAFFSFSEQGKNIIFEYKDNGLGHDAESTVRKNGLRIMENRISELKGKSTFDSTPGNGFRARIEFPK